MNKHPFLPTAHVTVPDCLSVEGPALSVGLVNTQFLKASFGSSVTLTPFSSRWVYHSGLLLILRWVSADSQGPICLSAG